MSPEKFVFIVWFIGTLEAIKETSAAGEKSALYTTRKLKCKKM